MRKVIAYFCFEISVLVVFSHCSFFWHVLLEIRERYFLLFSLVFECRVAFSGHVYRLLSQVPSAASLEFLQKAARNHTNPVLRHWCAQIVLPCTHVVQWQVW